MVPNYRHPRFIKVYPESCRPDRPLTSGGRRVPSVAVDGEGKHDVETGVDMGTGSRVVGGEGTISGRDSL